jgi:hypothetical protein
LEQEETKMRTQTVLRSCKQNISLVIHQRNVSFVSQGGIVSCYYRFVASLVTGDFPAYFGIGFFSGSAAHYEANYQDEYKLYLDY